MKQVNKANILILLDSISILFSYRILKNLTRTLVKIQMVINNNDLKVMCGTIERDNVLLMCLRY